uniref:Uncharacterized protein n=1 Tax=Amphimedon queenslandica TaxID=400682 RepID=A0A1X7SDV5_AMPQE
FCDWQRSNDNESIRNKEWPGLSVSKSKIPTGLERHSPQVLSAGERTIRQRD